VLALLVISFIFLMMLKIPIRPTAFKQQSAMEFLMTYGWAIIIVAVVLTSLYALGVFNPGSTLGTSCIPVSGHLCSSPLLHANTLTVTVGQATGASWTSTTIYLVSSPSSATAPCAAGTGILSNSIGTLASAMSSSISFFNVNSILPATAAVGGSGSGTLWAGYTSGSQSGLCTKIAAVILKAT